MSDTSPIDPDPETRRALDRLDSELRSGNGHPLDAVRAIAAEGRRGADPSATSAHDDLYDQSGLPK
jgi:antitoxin VapB